MKKSLYFLSFLLVCCQAYGQGNSSLFMNQMADRQIAVNNRILAKVNGKAISVLDAMKKMDMLFYRQFPEYTHSAEARFQFYTVNWKHVVNDLIDKEIILADAEEHKMPLTNGDVRQEMETMFGPNIIANLDKVGMSYDEAWKIVKGDIIIRRMLYARVNNKAMWEVTPQTVRAAYEDFARENIREEEWLYKVVSIRDKAPAKGKQAAEAVFELLQTKSTNLETLQAYLKEKELLPRTSSLNVSDEFRHNEKEMSNAYREVVTKLAPQEFGGPISQKSRTDGSTVFRIFYLTSKTDGGLPSFGELEIKLKEKLLGIAIEKETTAYLQKLRKHFDIQDLVEEEFQPFVLN